MLTNFFVSCSGGKQYFAKHEECSLFLSLSLSLHEEYSLLKYEPHPSSPPRSCQIKARSCNKLWSRFRQIISQWKKSISFQWLFRQIISEWKKNDFILMIVQTNNFTVRNFISMIVQTNNFTMKKIDFILMIYFSWTTKHKIYCGQVDNKLLCSTELMLSLLQTRNKIGSADQDSRYLHLLATEHCSHLIWQSKIPSLFLQISKRICVV